jgi:hypothetical protein
LKKITPFFQLVTTDVTFIEQRVRHPAFSQKVAAREVGMFKYQIQGMVRRDAVEGIKFGHLFGWNELVDHRIDIELQFPEVDVRTLDDPIIELF